MKKDYRLCVETINNTNFYTVREVYLDDDLNIVDINEEPVCIHVNDLTIPNKNGLTETQIKQAILHLLNSELDRISQALNQPVLDVSGIEKQYEDF